MYITCYSCQILMKLEFSRRFFEKYPNINFMIRLVGADLFMRTDGQDEADSRFCNFANSRKNGRGKFSNYI